MANEKPYTFGAGRIGVSLDLQMSDEHQEVVVSSVDPGTQADTLGVPVGGVLLSLSGPDGVSVPIKNMSVRATVDVLSKMQRPMTFIIRDPSTDEAEFKAVQAESAAERQKQAAAAAAEAQKAQEAKAARVAAEKANALRIVAASQSGRIRSIKFGEGPLGLSLQQSGESVVIISIQPGSQAAQLLAPTGVLVGIGGKSVSGLPKSEVSKLIGKATRPMSLQIRSAEDPPVADAKRDEEAAKFAKVAADLAAAEKAAEAVSVAEEVAAAEATKAKAAAERAVAARASLTASSKPAETAGGDASSGLVVKSRSQLVAEMDAAAAEMTEKAAAEKAAAELAAAEKAAAEKAAAEKAAAELAVAEKAAAEKAAAELAAAEKKAAEKAAAELAAAAAEKAAAEKAAAEKAAAEKAAAEKAAAEKAAAEKAAAEKAAARKAAAEKAAAEKAAEKAAADKAATPDYLAVLASAAAAKAAARATTQRDPRAGGGSPSGSVADAEPGLRGEAAQTPEMGGKSHADATGDEAGRKGAQGTDELTRTRGRGEAHVATPVKKPSPVPIASSPVPALALPVPSDDEAREAQRARGGLTGRLVTGGRAASPTLMRMADTRVGVHYCRENTPRVTPDAPLPFGGLWNFDCANATANGSARCPSPPRAIAETPTAALPIEAMEAQVGAHGTELMTPRGETAFVRKGSLAKAAYFEQFTNGRTHEPRAKEPSSARLAHPPDGAAMGLPPPPPGAATARSASPWRSPPLHEGEPRGSSHSARQPSAPASHAAAVRTSGGAAALVGKGAAALAPASAPAAATGLLDVEEVQAHQRIREAIAGLALQVPRPSPPRP